MFKRIEPGLASLRDSPSCLLGNEYSINFTQADIKMARIIAFKVGLTFQKMNLIAGTTKNVSALVF